MKRPIFIFLIFFILGILVSEFIFIDLSFLFLVCFLYIVLKKVYGNYAFLIMVVFLIGVIFPIIKTPKLEFGEYNIHGKIIEKNELDYTNVYLIKTYLINDDTKYLNIELTDKKEYEIDDLVKIRGKIKKIHSENNFLMFNNTRYKKSKLIFYEMDPISSSYLGHKESIRNKVIESISKVFDEKLDFKTAEIMKSMILGVSNDSEIKEKFGKIGIVHILAISGLHINILISFLESIGKRLKFSKKYFGIFVIIFLVIYGYIINFPISMIRALSIFLLEYIAIYTYSVKDKLSIFFISMFLVLIINPFYIYSIGFYLSYLAIFSIYYIAPKLKKIFNILPDIFVIPISIQIMTFPILIYFFNAINLISFVINTAIIPLFSIFLILGFLLIFIRINLLALIINSLFSFILLIVNSISTFSNIYEMKFYNMTFFKLILFYLFIYYILNYRFIHYKLRKTSNKYILSILIIFLIFKALVPKVTVNFVDVGQGDATLIRSKNQVIMIDTGGNPMNIESSGKKLVEYLNRNGIFKIDNIFISHADMDHAGNLYYMIKNIDIENIYSNHLKKFKTISLNKNDKLNIDRMLFHIVLDGKNENSSNDSSIVILANIFDKKLLFTGDIEENEKDIILNENIDILKVSHHGSKYSTSNIFLENNSIDNAIISVGKDNRYGHPHDELLKRLERNNISIYRTDKDGNIEITFNPLGYHIKTYNRKSSIINLLIELILY